LYDLKNDPYHVQNVATVPELAGVKKKLAERLLDVLLKHGDPRFVEDTCRFEVPPFTNKPN